MADDPSLPLPFASAGRAIIRQNVALSLHQGRPGAALAGVATLWMVVLPTWARRSSSP
jgi:hypothetical protein